MLEPSHLNWFEYIIVYYAAPIAFGHTVGDWLAHWWWGGRN